MAGVIQQSKQHDGTASGQLSLSFVSDSEDSTYGATSVAVLDPGCIEVLGCMGTDLTVVNAARVSYGKQITALEQKDKDLLKFLAENRHTAPFRHVTMQFRISAPEFVARQWYKHVVGADYAFKDTAWNEQSQRYVEAEEDFHYPDTWRRQDGTGVGDPQRCRSLYAEATAVAFDTYQRLRKQGVAREQARMVLPLSVYTTWIWTASLQAIAHFVELRRSPHAQAEIREYAEVLHKLAAEYFPHSYTALVEYGV